MVQEITDSVGAREKGAKNLFEDVITIQELLETAAEMSGRAAFDPKGVDGKIANPPRESSTVKAIKAIQGAFMRSPDGLIEPNKHTLQRLNAFEINHPNKPANSGLIVGGVMNFPFSFVPNQSYKTGARYFGARRSKGKRKHAGCDLIAPEGTKIYAVDDGTIIRGPYSFYRGTYAIEVQHTNFIARYCEIKKTAQGVRKGSQVQKGQVIAYVGKMYYSSMLHFEIYRGDATGPLTQRNNPPYQRRSDLLDPTDCLDRWKNYLPS